MPSKPANAENCRLREMRIGFTLLVPVGFMQKIDVTKAGDRSGTTASRRDSEIKCEAAFPNELGARLFGHRRAVHRRGETRFCKPVGKSRHTKHLLPCVNAR